MQGGAALINLVSIAVAVMVCHLPDLGLWHQYRLQSLEVSLFIDQNDVNCGTFSWGAGC